MSRKLLAPTHPWLKPLSHSITQSSPSSSLNADAHTDFLLLQPRTLTCHLSSSHLACPHPFLHPLSTPIRHQTLVHLEISTPAITPPFLHSPAWKGPSIHSVAPGTCLSFRAVSCRVLPCRALSLCLSAVSRPQYHSREEPDRLRGTYSSQRDGIQTNDRLVRVRH